MDRLIMEASLQDMDVLVRVARVSSRLENIELVLYLIVPHNCNDWIRIPSRSSEHVFCNRFRHAIIIESSQAKYNQADCSTSNISHCMQFQASSFLVPTNWRWNSHSNIHSTKWTDAQSYRITMPEHRLAHESTTRVFQYVTRWPREIRRCDCYQEKPGINCRRSVIPNKPPERQLTVLLQVYLSWVQECGIVCYGRMWVFLFGM